MAKANTDSGEGKLKPFRITASQDQVQVGVDGRLTEVKTFFYITPFGDSGRISVPKAEFSAERVAELIEAEVMELFKLREG